MEKIKVVINKDGSLEYDVKGVKGKGCKALTEFIDKITKVISSKKTSEYFEKEDPTKVRTRG